MKNTTNTRSMFDLILDRTKRVASTSLELGHAEQLTRQLDVALMSVGFKLSKELFDHLASRHPSGVQNVVNSIVSSVKKMVGAHVNHNVYFKTFPKNVPDTQSFWTACIMDALSKAESARVVGPQVASGTVNLLDFPLYGKYLHSYEEMVANQEAFIPSLKGRVQILHLGGTLKEETIRLYHQLSASAVPLNGDDLVLVGELAELCLDDPQPVRFPVRENKAMVNMVRILNGRNVVVDAPTDILRLACALSKGDVTLATKTKFQNISRKVRRGMMNTLGVVLNDSPEKSMDVVRHLEAWKRLGEKIHPHEFSDSFYAEARNFFAIARGDEKANSLASQVEKAIQGTLDIQKAILLLEKNPGMLFRALDRMMLLSHGLEVTALEGSVKKVISKVSARVILSVWEHLMNRVSNNPSRMFSNTKGKTWTTKETRPELPVERVNAMINLFKEEIRNRFQKMGIRKVLADRDSLGLSLPLSEKNKSTGFGIMPKGSEIPVSGDTIRFFMYWKQKSMRTDYDLSVMLMDSAFNLTEQCSWTMIRLSAMTHSGDITSAPDGASEFIDVNLKEVSAGNSYFIPQVNLFAGEDFSEVEESLFGFMERTKAQKGLPFEARTVRVKSEVRGKGKVALPCVFIRKEDNTWTCKWVDFQLMGHPNMNMVEGNKASTAKLMKAVVDRAYLTVQDLVDLLPGDSSTGPENTAQVSFQKPEGADPKVRFFTLDNLASLIPE